MSTFIRTIRPFVGLDHLQRILDAEIRLFVGPEMLEPNGSLALPPDQFLSRDVVLQLAASDELFEVMATGLEQRCADAGYSTEDVQLVVVASSPYLKFADVLLARPIAELRDVGRRLVLSAPTRARALSSPRSGCTIDVYLALGRSQSARPLHAWRRGTWLAQAQFKLSSDLAAIGFTPRPLTEEVRTRYALPDETVRFVTFEEDESPLERASSESALLMYVDPDVLAKMAVAAHKPASQLFQVQLFLDAVRAIVDRCRCTEGFDHVTVDDLEDTIMGRLLDALCRRPGQSTDQRHVDMHNLLSMAKQRPESFIGRAEAAVGFRKLLDEVLGL